MSDCRVDLELLINDVNVNKTDQNHDLYQCESVYIGANSEKLANKAFENGVVKIQNGDTANMIIFEKNTCISLEVHNPNIAENIKDETTMTYKERREQLKIKSTNDIQDYGCLYFIVGSAAVVERLWSIADKLIDGDRNNTTPLLMEILLHLFENRTFWNEGYV